MKRLPIIQRRWPTRLQPLQARLLSIRAVLRRRHRARKLARGYDHIAQIIIERRNRAA